MHPWLLSTLGGVLIGLSAVMLMGTLGRVAGISGIASGLLAGASDRGWRVAFVLGLVAAPLLLLWLHGHSGIGAPQVGWPLMAVAGLLVGFGTRLGGGCTSGHGVCGLSRGSPRSFTATLVFMAFGVLTATFAHRLFGGPS